MSREEAEQWLKSFPFDCFLVRESENRVGQFSLSLSHRGTVKHFRIDRKRGSGRYELYGAQWSFPSVLDMVEYYMQHCVTTEGELLSTPCPAEVRWNMQEHTCTVLVLYMSLSSNI